MAIASTTQTPVVVLTWRFFTRTMLVALLTLVVVAMTIAVYGHPSWAGVYLAAGVWALGFLALTPLILKALLFDRRPRRGLVLFLVKFFWLGLVFWAFAHWNRAGAGTSLPGPALVAGVTTTLMVIVLRALGGAMEAGPDESGRAGPSEAPPRPAKPLTEEKP